MSEQEQQLVDITPEGSVTPIYLVELTQQELDERAQWEEEAQAATELEVAKEQAKQSALAKLALLGLTEEEAKAVIGL